MVSLKEQTTDWDIVYESDKLCVINEPLNKVIVATSGSANGKGRSHKTQCYIYCEKLDYKLHRHLEQQHSNEIEVAKILNMPKRSKERKQAWAAITAKGNNLHITKVKEKGVGILIPKYRQSKEQDRKKYLSCEFCRMLIILTDLCKHHRICVSKPDRVKSDAPVKNSKLLEACASTEKAGINEQFYKKVVVNIKED
ncbi:hypothetical protein DPMN_070409 [Dreissena polymorpha]|uniref:Uncharacterized protein n=1 Tax=Dreissena polymorpha TaxID=45954 RepID=A0A9D4BNW4_DREPO|nr:hypothetical protein DPMN_070409 [Dreissena polymorpha]